MLATLGEMSGADKIMNPKHFGSNPADIRIRISKTWIELVEVGCLGGGLRAVSEHVRSLVCGRNRLRVWTVNM